MISRMKKRIAGGFTLIELMVVVAIIGILAAVAIPAFMKNAKKAKTTEATINVKKIYDGALSYYHEEKNAAGSAVPIAKQFPSVGGVAGATQDVEPAAGPATCCGSTGQKCAPNAALWTDPVWQALKFSMDDPHYYAYSYAHSQANTWGSNVTPTTPANATEYFFADGLGDLNCDTTLSTFEMMGAVDPATYTITGQAGMFKNNELE